MTAWLGRNILLYDGHCPLCSHAADYYRLQEALPNLELISMREAPGRDLIAGLSDTKPEAGMILLLADGSVRQGKYALRFIHSVLVPGGIFERLAKVMLQSEVLSALIYPLLRLARRLSLFVLGRSARIGS